MKLSKVWEIALGVVTAVGGFLDVGAIATAAQAGSEYRFALIWPVVLATICVIFLVEMSGRLAAISHHPLPSAIRERFGFNYAIWPLVAELTVDFLVLASEIGGVCIALQLVTGINYRWWTIPVVFLAWATLWYGTFDWVEYGVSFLGLITVSFIVGAFMTHPPVHEMLRGLVPTWPKQQPAHHGFLAVSIIGSIIAPFLLNFYSSGAVEDEWDESDLGLNRWTAALGMSFGMVIQIGVLVLAAMVLQPHGIIVERYEQAAIILATPMGLAGFYLFAASLAVACFGAALQVSLDSAYIMAQNMGWNWGENLRPVQSARFHLVYTVFLFPCAALIIFGPNPLKLTIFSMAITTLILPLIVLPFIVLMNDKRYLGEHCNGWISNAAVFVIIILTFLLAAVAIPLEILGGS